MYTTTIRDIAYFPIYPSDNENTNFEMREINEELGIEQGFQAQMKPFAKKNYSPLDSDDSALLCKYIYNKLVINNPIEKVSYLEKAPVFLASTVAIVSGYVSWYPLILGVTKIGIKNKQIKVILAGGSWIAYGSLFAWGTLKIVQEVFDKHSVTEAALIKNTTHPCLSILYKGTIAFLALTGTLPTAYFAYIFNNKSIMWTLVNIAGSWGINAYSIHNMIFETQLGCTKYAHFGTCAETRKWNEVREFLIHKLDDLITRIPMMESSVIEKIFELVDPDQEEINKAQKFAQIFFERILGQYNEEVRITDPVESFLNQKKIQYPVKILSALLPISSIFANAKATWNLVSAFTDFTVVKAIIVPIALVPSYLTFSLNRDCLLFFIRKIAGKALKQESNSMSSVHYPKTRLCVILTASILALLSSGIDYATAREIYPEDSVKDWTATIASVVNSVALTLLPMIDLSTELLDLSISLLANHAYKYKYNISQKIEKLNYFIPHSSQKEFEKFIGNLMNNEHLSKELKGRFPWLASTDIRFF